MTDDLKHSQLRAIQYFYADGSFEFGFGLLCLLLGVYFFIETHVQGWLSAVVDGSLVLVMIGGAWLIKRLIKRLKENVTWPRTGYVAYTRQGGLKRSVRMALGGTVGGSVAVVVMLLVTNPNIHFAVMPLISGLLLGLVLAILGWRSRLPRLYLLATISLLGGLALSFSRLGNSSSMTVYYLGMSLVLFASGVCVLRAYLRQNPVSPETGNEY